MLKSSALKLLLMVSLMLGLTCANAQQNDVNATDAYGSTALHQAVEAGDIRSAQRLIDQGADVSIKNRYNISALSIAAMQGNAEMLELLLNAGADPNTISGQGEPVIMTVARLGSLESVEVLLAAGVDVNVRDRLYGQTAVMWAAIENHAELIPVLAQHGANVNFRANILEGEPKWREGTDNRTGVNGEALQVYNTGFTRGGLTALMYASREGSTEAALALLENGGNPNLTDPEGYTPLLVAIINAHYDTAAALVEAGVDVNQSMNGQSPLYALVDMRSLMWSYNRPTPTAENHITTLALAEMLLDHGAQVDAALTARHIRPTGGGSFMRAGTTPFIRASLVADLPVMNLLLEHGADPLAETADGVNALHMASGFNWDDNTMKTSRTLGFGVEVDALAAIDLLLDAGLDINAADHEGYTAMHYAATRGSTEIIQYLYEHGAQVNVRANDKIIPPNAFRGFPEMTEPGKSPIDIATEKAIADPTRRPAVDLLNSLAGM